MIASVPVLRANGERNPPSCALEAPLRQAWKVRGGLSPLIDGRRRHVVLNQLDGNASSIVALDLETGGVKWRATSKKPALGTLVALVDDVVVASAWPRFLVLLDADTGEIQAQFGDPEVNLSATVAAFHGRRIILQDYRTIYALELPEGRIVWSRKAPYDPPEHLVFFTEAFCATAEWVVTAFTDGTALALSAADGREIWHVDVGDTVRDRDTGAPAGRMRGVPCIHEDAVIFSPAYDKLTCLALDGGSLRWSQEAPCGMRGGYLTGDRYYCVNGHAGAADYAILDASTGRVLASAKLDVPRSLVRAHVDGPRDLVTSGTHIVGGTGQGAILAYEREGGRYVWSGRYSSAINRLGGLVLTDGYVLACDEAFVTCLAGGGEADSLEASSSRREPEAGLLPFDIVSIDDAGVCHCQTRDSGRAPFSLKIGNDVRMAVSTPEDGDRLLRCFRRWFPVVPSPRFGRTDRVAGPLRFEGLERHDDDRVEATWFADDEDDAELSVHVSVAERTGHFEEKEDHGRRAILSRVAALVHRKRR